MNELLQRLAEYLSRQRDIVLLEQIHGAFSDQHTIAVDEALNLLREKRLVRATLLGDSVQLTPDGITAIEDGSLLSIVLGERYIAEHFGPATVHIIVRGRDGDEAHGSGFFSGDFPGWVVTAAHVLENREILRIENSAGEAISSGPFSHALAPPPIDLALLRCTMPNNLAPIFIEWRQNFVRPPEDLLILGYPPFPSMMPALNYSRAQLIALTKKIGSAIDSFIISSVTRPGFSGGPLLSSRGLAIGILEQENIRETLDQRHPLAYFSGIPTRYCREIRIPV